MAITPKRKQPAARTATGNPPAGFRYRKGGPATPRGWHNAWIQWAASQTRLGSKDQVKAARRLRIENRQQLIAVIAAAIARTDEGNRSECANGHE